MAALADFAGASALADLAGTDVPAVAGMKFSAIAEVHSSAVDDEGAPLVIRTSKQRSAVFEIDPVGADKKYRGPMDGMSVPEPLEHSVVGVPLEVGDSSVDGVTVPNPIEHSGVTESADPPSASQPMTHSEVSGDWKHGQQDHTFDGSMLRDIWRKDKRPSPEDGEAIVVGAVGSAAPWFLTVWAEEVEIEFMIETIRK